MRPPVALAFSLELSAVLMSLAPPAASPIMFVYGFWVSLIGLFCWIKTRKTILRHLFRREVKPLGVITHGQRNKPRACRKEIMEFFFLPRKRQRYPMPRRDPWFQEERRIQEITRARKGCELAVIILNTKATPTRHHPISISSPTLNSHCVIALSLIIISLVRDRTKLTKRKGRAQWGRGVRASTAGRGEGGGAVIGVFFHDEVAGRPVQLIEGLHGLPDNLFDRIDGRRWVSPFCRGP